VKLRWLGTESGKTGCPSLYETDRGTFVVQGWKITDSEALDQLGIPDHEAVIEIPKALMDHLPREDRENTQR
jgi:hypothetical protein